MRCNNKKFFLYISTIFWIGKFPVFPGTISSILSAVFFFFLFHLSDIFYLLIILVLFIIFSIYICENSEIILGVRDCSYIVLDEFVGMFFAIICLKKSLKLITMGIIIFRILDIWKPWPIRYFDKNIKGGIGIILDDILAGIFTNLFLKYIVHIKFFVLH